MTTSQIPGRLTLGGVSRNLADGVGQIFFQPSWLAGLLILLGIAVASVPMAAITALGTLVATASARLVGLATVHGLQGYCGALVGAASWAAFGEVWPATLATVLGAAACPAATQALAWVFARMPVAGGPLPVLTAPFCIVSGIVALLARAVMPAVQLAPVVYEGGALELFAVAVFAGISQVVLVESWLSGVVILAGLFVAGWRVGVAGLLGSVLGTLTAWAAGTPLAELAMGLAGYSPCLVAIAIAAVFLRPGAFAWGLAAVGAVVTVGVQWLVAMTPIPVYTWPFILVTWLVLVLWGRRRG